MKALPLALVVGKSYAWGSYGPQGWAIWVQARPAAPILRFGPEEREKARRLFEQLDRLDETPVPELAPDDGSEFITTLERLFEQLNRLDETPPAETIHDDGSELEPLLERALFRASQPSEPMPPPLDLAPVPVSGPTSNIIKVAVGVITLTVLVAVATQLPRGPGADPRRAGSSSFPAPDGVPPSGPGNASGLSDDPPSVPGVRGYANSSGGYLFSYPGSWTVSERGADAYLMSPDGTVRVVFGQAPGRSLSRASDLLVEQVMSSDGVQVLSSSRRSTEQGLRSALVGGTVNQNGVEGRFLAISVEGFDDNKAITVYFPRGREALEALGAIRAVISSYRVSTLA